MKIRKNKQRNKNKTPIKQEMEKTNNNQSQEKNGKQTPKINKKNEKTKKEIFFVFHQIPLWI